MNFVPTNHHFSVLGRSVALLTYRVNDSFVPYFRVDLLGCKDFTSQSNESAKSMSVFNLMFVRCHIRAILLTCCLSHHSIISRS